MAGTCKLFELVRYFWAQLQIFGLLPEQIFHSGVDDFKCKNVKYMHDSSET